MLYTARNDPGIRRRDYQQALRLWLQDPNYDKIVFCENSGSHLEDLMRIARDHNPFQKEVEFLSFKERGFPVHKGKAYGEIGIIEHVLRESNLVYESSHLVKMTGRLYAPNTHPIVECLQKHSDISVFCNIGRNMTDAECRLIAARKTFYQEYLVPLREVCDEANQLFMEQIVARAIHRAMADGHKWSLLPVVPNIQGHSGSHNFKYDVSKTHHLFTSALRSAKAYFLSRR
jgi:hypothetical protein